MITFKGQSIYNPTPESLKFLGFDDDEIVEIIKLNEWWEIRKMRDARISETDKEYLRHDRELRCGKIVDDESNPTTLSGAQLAVLDDYVQKLADIPQTYSNPGDVVWPVKPDL